MRAHERAEQIWPILVDAARDRRTLTYDELGRIIGVPRFGLAQLLEPIQAYCLQNGRPALTSVVINDSGRPGSGFIAAQDIQAEHQRVFNHDWDGDGQPRAAQLLAAARWRDAG